MWDDLSMTERAKYIGLAVQSGITNPSIIRSRYNSFARGGYTKWKEAIQRHKGIQIDGDDTYDYVSFYNDDPDRAWDMLNKDSKSHFVDTYKTAKHPSFSVESKYSSSPDNLLNINKYNPLGITGGTWRDNDYTYQLSEDQVNTDWDTDRTYDYFEKAEPHPMSIMSPDGANYLRSITVTPKSNRFDGGGRKYRVQGTQGTNYGEFDTKEAAQQYIANNNMEQYFEETLPEFTVTAPTQGNAPNIFKEDYDALLGSKRVNTVNKAWTQYPEVMQQFQDANNVVGGIASIPMVAPLYELPVIAGAYNLSAVYEGLNNLFNEEGIHKTYNLFKQGDYSRGLQSAAGDLWDLALSYLALSKLRGIPSEYNNIRNIQNSYDVVNNYYNEVTDNLNFIRKFNKWNERYGYAPLSEKLENNTEVLNQAIQDRLRQHNRFTRGVFVDKNNPFYNDTVELLRNEGIEPTDDNVLEWLATHYIEEGGRGGRAGLYNIPLANDMIKEGKTPGTIYTSNSYEQAKGYALRNGADKPHGVFDVERPLDFSGSREDWVQNAEFPFTNNMFRRNESMYYYKYDLPYLMKYGKIKPPTRKLKKGIANNIYKENNNHWEILADDIRKIGKELNVDMEPVLKKAGYGKVGSYINSWGKNRRSLKQYAVMNYLQNKLENVRIDYNLNPNSIEDGFLKNSLDIIKSEVKGYSFKRKIEDNLYRLIKEEAPYTKELITTTGNVGTSEQLNINKENPFQHFIFVGNPNEQGLNLIRKVPEKEWINLNGSTAHGGHWSEGLSRKSYAEGGNIN
jgi:hypothetical protein